jgi:hypothetical protein
MHSGGPGIASYARTRRRGDTLRSRRLRRLRMLAGLTVAAVVTGCTPTASSASGNMTRAAEQPPRPAACAASIVTVPKAKVPSDVARWAGGAPVVGDDALWTIRSAINVPAVRQPHGWYFLKFPWYARPFGLPSISGRRLDGAGSFRADANQAVDARGVWVVSSLEFSHPGCWEVTSRYRSTSTSSPTSTTERGPTFLERFASTGAASPDREHARERPCAGDMGRSRADVLG